MDNLLEIFADAKITVEEAKNHSKQSILFIMESEWMLTSPKIQIQNNG